jgi:hypothetical protein
MPVPGEVFYLPPDPREPEGKGHRPHVLLSLCVPGTDLVTLAYGSTKRNDAAFGAEHVLVDPFANTYRGTGLVQPTYVYPSRLVSRSVDIPGSCAGRIIDELPSIRAGLARALGLGTGVTREANVRGSNRRGRVIETSEEVVTDWDVTHALVVTEPGYSRYGYQQTVIPLLDQSFEQRDLDVGIFDPSWLGTSSARYRNGMIAVPMVSTLFLPEHIARFLDVVVPADVMDEVDRALAAHFALERRV